MELSQYNKAKERLNGRLYAPYQQDGVMWMLEKENSTHGPKGAILADDMGIGKSVQVIATILGNEKPKTLIIVPKSLVTQWVEEIKKFAPQLRVYVYDGPDRTTNLRDFELQDIIISPYTLLVSKGKQRGAHGLLHQVRWNRIVLDEAHEIRNKSSKLFSSVSQLYGEIKWIVTGTPVFNSIRDFVTLCMFLGIEKNVVLGMTQKVKDMYILRRTKEDLAIINERLAMPPCYFENVELQMYPDEKRLYQSAFTEGQDTVREIFKTTVHLNSKNMEILECLLRVRQVMILPQLYINGMSKKNNVVAEKWMGKSKKMETLFEMIHGHPTEKSLVFCQFRGEMDHIQKSLGCPVFRIDGSVPKEERTAQIKDFKKGPPNSVFLIQIKAGGQGLNLQEATRVYIMSPSWNPATELQAIGRSHRSGQSKCVYVKKLIYKGDESCPSVEESIMNLQEHKSMICANVLNDKRLETQIPLSRSNVSILDIKKIFKV